MVMPRAIEPRHSLKPDPPTEMPQISDTDYVLMAELFYPVQLTKALSGLKGLLAFLLVESLRKPSPLLRHEY